MIPPATLSLDSVLEAHQMILDRTGGAPGVRDLNALRAALERPLSGFAQVELFPTAFLKAAALGHGIATAHPFVDGNKRTGLLAAASMLELYGWALEAAPEEQDATMVSLALKETSLEQFAQWLEDHAEPV